MAKYLLFLLSIFTFAQDDLLLKSPSGNEFWLCFMKNHKEQAKTKESIVSNFNQDEQLNLEVFITCDIDSKVKLEIKAIGYSEEVFVKGGTVKNIKISPLAIIKSSEVIEENYALHIVSDNPVTVYGLNRRRLTTDTFMAFPISVLGKEYRTVSYDKSVQLMSQFAIVATEDDTEMKIKPTTPTYGGNSADKIFKIKLNKGDVYQVNADNSDSEYLKADLTGSYIAADKKIAVFSGHQCAYVPRDLIACNHLVEQLPPLSSWGKHYYVGNLSSRTSFVYRVVASNPETKVFIDYKLVKVLNEGEFYEGRTDREVQITANQPILVSQYSEGFSNGDQVGDPMMLLISPTQQFLDKYRFATPVNGFWKHYLNVVVPTNSISTLTLDGKKIGKNKFKKFGTSDYSIAYLQVKYGTHEISCSEPFGLSCYGFGYDEDKFDAYGNLAGQSFKVINQWQDIIAPRAKYSQLEDVQIFEISEVNTNTKERNVARDTLTSFVYYIIVSDDDINDSGVLSVEIKESQNISFEIQEFDVGSPQIKVKATATDKNNNGSLVFNTTDMEGNSKIYTLCYVFDPVNGEFENIISEGKVDCQSFEKSSVSLFLKNSFIDHTLNFAQTGDISALSNFTGARGNNLGLGLAYNFNLNPNINISLRLLFDKFNGEIIAPYFSDQIQNPENGELEPNQEIIRMNLDKRNVGFVFATNYHINSFIYITGGLRMTYVNNNITPEIHLSQPVWALHNNGSRNKPLQINGQNINEIESINSVIFGANIGFGFEKNISGKYSILSEFKIDSNLGSILSDADWLVQQFYFNVGVNYFFKK